MSNPLPYTTSRSGTSQSFVVLYLRTKLMAAPFPICPWWRANCSSLTFSSCGEVKEGKVHVRSGEVRDVHVQGGGRERDVQEAS